MKLVRALLPVMLVALSACTPSDPPLRVGLLVWPPYELAMLAREKGWLDGADIRLLEYHSPAELTRAFRNGLLDAMFVTSHISLRLADTGVDHRIVYVIDFSEGGDALVVKDRVGGLKDLRGRRIGVEPSALGAYVFQRVLDFAELQRSEVDIVPLDVPKQLPLWKRDRIDAVVCYEPVRTQLVNHGGRILVDSRGMPLEIADVVIAQDATVKTRSQALKVLLRGMTRALDHYRRAPESTLAIMAPRESLSPEAFHLALGGARLIDAAENRRLLRGDEPELQAALAQQVEVMRRAGLLNGQPDLARLIDGRFVCEGCLQ